MFSLLSATRIHIWVALCVALILPRTSACLRRRSRRRRNAYSRNANQFSSLRARECLTNHRAHYLGTSHDIVPDVCLNAAVCCVALGRAFDWTGLKRMAKHRVFVQLSWTQLHMRVPIRSFSRLGRFTDWNGQDLVNVSLIQSVSL